ncbi:MAG: hypothetical protein JWQ90_5374 [Hydrocarboniphaga sp.]|uniref:outer membrane lipoprotein-sorting protein n=1 Tax=Hydrocarboniphaga sp. TaxID=2033016 RepID=UPI00260E7A37|nr:outer membrane lipoprotein-sorting protein [Hydrocarboniphaga sp.]MDB5972924.1 hypothetical protein [Hydrocarboniphaga sp.]
MKSAFACASGLAVMLLAGTAGAAGKKPAAPEPETAATPPALNVTTATVNEINTCSRGNLADRGSLRDVTLMSKGRDGKERTLKLKLFWKPAKGTGEGRLNVRVVEPKDLAGASYLLIQKEGAEQLYFYLPAANKVQQVSGEDLNRPLWGTDLSYSDLKQLQGLAATGPTTRIADQLVAGLPSYVLETQLADGTPQYSKMRSYVDQKSCVPLRSDFLDKSGKTVKQLEADASTLSELEPYWFVTAYTMKDLVRNSQTAVELSDVYLLEQMSEKNFAPDTFYLKNE